MDPNEASRIIHDRKASPSERYDAAAGLQSWIASGGFLPTYGDTMPDGQPFCNREWWLCYLPGVMGTMRRLMAQETARSA